MEKKKWLVDLTRENPMLALVAVLIIGISATAGVSSLLYQDGSRDKVRVITENIRLRYEKDSIIRACRVEVKQCQDDLVRRLDAANEELRKQYERQLQVNARQAVIATRATRTAAENNNKIVTIKQKIDEN